MKNPLRLAVAVALLATAMIGTVSAAALYVSLESTNPIPPFASWATAATNIQQAVDAAKAGDTVLVTNGVYQVGEREVSVWDTNSSPPQVVSRELSRVVITNSIRLESVNGPLLTIIQGVPCPYPVRCVYLGTDAVASGFTLTNGVAGGGGGGVRCVSTNCVLTNCVIIGNRADACDMGESGGGVCGGTLYNCTLTGNWAKGGAGASGSLLYNCALTGNSAYATGGGAAGCTLYNCTLTGNSGGGAISSTLYNCTLTGNSGGSGGGASSCTLYNCTLAGNSAEFGGGAFGSTLCDCTLTDNSAWVGGGACGDGSSPCTLYNCIVYYNTAANGPNYLMGLIPNGGEWYTLLNYCCTTPLSTSGVGNIAGPPLFMDMAAGDFRLREDSPCIDSGTNLLSVVGYSYDSTDILGNTRFIDGNGDGKVAWDIGAYEFNSFKPPRFSVQPQLTADGWQLTVTGAPNKWARLQRSANLKDWADIWSGFMGAEAVQQVNVGDTGPKAMFYRVVLP